MPVARRELLLGIGGVNDPGCGKDGETAFSVRQTSLSFKSIIPTAVGETRTEELRSFRCRRREYRNSPAECLG
jgi:hypothetical protein